jgi:superfamily II DNA helicase RecQ
LLFIAPERLLTPRFLQLAEKVKIHAFAIDKARIALATGAMTFGPSIAGWPS